MDLTVGVDAEEDAGVTGEKVRWAWSSPRMMDNDAGPLSIDLAMQIARI